VSGGTFIDREALERSLSALRERTAGDALDDALEHVIMGARQLFDASGAGIMLVDESSVLAFVAATDEPGQLLERRQEQIGEGPCVDSLTFDRVVCTADLRDDERWAALTPDVAAAGVRAVLGVPIRTAEVPVGSLNVYRNHPSDWSRSEITALQAYAGLLESLLAAALQARDRGRLAEQLQHALNHRVVIERAVGVIMGRENIDAVTAFNRLRTIARSAERKVADVAGELLGEIPGNA
jgi:GAF domain-containing protein